MADERNFRSHYYEKMGFRGIEEKKSLEILLKEQPLDLQRLSQFCLRFPVAGIYREIVWKVLLKMLPAHISIHDFVREQRIEQYNDLDHALRIMRRIDDTTDQPTVFLKMYYLEEGQMMFDEEQQLEQPNSKAFISIASTFMQIFPTPVDAYWLSKQFYKQLENSRLQLSVLHEKTDCYLKKEVPTLYAHLKQIDAIQALPLEEWFFSCFAVVLPEGVIERIWDIIIGGSCKILVYVAVAFLAVMERHLLRVTDAAEAVECVRQDLAEGTAELVVSKGLELWYKHGCQLMPGSKLDTHDSLATNVSLPPG